MFNIVITPINIGFNIMFNNKIPSQTLNATREVYVSFRYKYTKKKSQWGKSSCGYTNEEILDIVGAIDMVCQV